MKVLLGFTLIGLLLAAACSTPGPVTGRPDPAASTSGTLGSVKATDGPTSHFVQQSLKKLDSARRANDSTY